MLSANRLRSLREARYLELTPEHLARFIEALGGDIAVDGGRVAELLRPGAILGGQEWPSGNIEYARSVGVRLGKSKNN